MWLVGRSGVVVSAFRVVSVRAGVFDSVRGAASVRELVRLVDASPGLVDLADVFVSVRDVVPSREAGAFVDAFDPAGAATFAAASGLAATRVRGFPPFALAYEVLSARAVAACCV